MPFVAGGHQIDTELNFIAEHEVFPVRLPFLIIPLINLANLLVDQILDVGSAEKFTNAKGQVLLILDGFQAELPVQCLHFLMIGFTQLSR